MIIEKIKIYNFRTFCGSHDLEFPNNGYGVHLIRGDNGHGKTSIQEAIIWGLYGKIEDKNGEEIPLTSLLNFSARDDNIYKFGVQIAFTHGLDKYESVRQMQAKDHSNSRYKEGHSFKIKKNQKIIEGIQAENEIRRILPFEVSRFYFFDGEMLEQYENLLNPEKSHTLLRNSIEMVLGVPYLRQAKDNLLQLQKSYENSRSRLIREFGGKDYAELDASLQEISGNIDFQTESINNIVTQRIELEKDLNKASAELAGKRGLEDLLQRQEAIKHDKELVKKDLNDEYEKMKRLTEDLYKTELIPVAKQVIQNLDDRFKSSVEEYNNKQYLLKKEKEINEGIQGQTCKLCRRPLNKKAVRQLQHELANVRERLAIIGPAVDLNADYVTYKAELEKMISNAISREQFSDVYKNIYTHQNKLAIDEQNLAEISEKFEGDNPLELERLQKSIQYKKVELAVLTEREKNEREKLSVLNSDKELVEKDMGCIKQEEINVLFKKISYAKNIAKVFDKAISEYVSIRRSDVEQVASSIFKQMRSKEDFEKLLINDQYGLSILTSKGRKLDRMEFRSTGEGQIIALSLLGALNKCTQIRAPVVMDTPLASLDMKIGKRVLEYVPNFADQVILLVTDREFGEEEMQYLEGHIKSDYTVVFKNQSEGSFIRLT